MARSISKQVKTTHIDVYRADFDTMAIVKVGEFDVPGGLGDRLCKARAVREYGEGVTVKTSTSYARYKMDFNTFIANAVRVADDDTSTDVNEDID